jgi:hypothetical protein
MKKLLFWTNPIFMVLLFLACGSGNSQSHSETTASADTTVMPDSISSKDSIVLRESPTSVPNAQTSEKDTSKLSSKTSTGVANNPGTAGQNTQNQNTKSGKTPPKEKKEAPKPGKIDSDQLDSLKKSKAQLKK